MWIEDLTMALWVLNGESIKWKCCVEKIENNYIVMTSRKKFYIPDLVAKYKEMYSG